MSRDLIIKTIELLDSEFRSHSNYENGLGMSKYMKDRFSFYGVNSPKRKEIYRLWLSSLPDDLMNENRWNLVHRLWEKDEREFQYITIDWMNSWNKKFISSKDDEQLRWLITNNSWWDSVDSIASNYLGKYCNLFPEKAKQLVEEWRNSDNMWLNRSCLIYQLKYANKVDFDLLKSLIIQYQPVKEFFIQKAIGWSLRQYSKFNPDAVRDFVNEIDLRGIAKREASKYL